MSVAGSLSRCIDVCLTNVAELRAPCSARLVGRNSEAYSATRPRRSLERVNRDPQIDGSYGRLLAHRHLYVRMVAQVRRAERACAQNGGIRFAIPPYVLRTC